MRKHKPDIVIALIALSLILAGTIVIFAVGPRVAETKGAPSNTYILHHLPMVAGAIFMMIFMALDWQNLVAKLSRKFLKRTIVIPRNEVILEKYALKLLTIAAIMTAAIAVLGSFGFPLVECNLGACRSFRIAGFGFQAVELFKFAVMVYVASLIAKRKREKTFDKKEMWIPIIAIIAFTGAFVCVGQKDLGSTVVIVFMILAMLFIAGVSMKNMAKIFFALLLVAVPMIVLFPHRVERLLGFAETSYHLENSLIGIGTGGITGVGLGNSVQAVGYLPEALTDSIFSVVCEAWGLVGAVAIILAFALLLRRILKVAMHSKNTMMRLMAVAVFAWIFAHVIINVCGIIGLIPMKGITLSFLSYGGTSLLFTGAAVGVVLYISGWTRREEVIIDEDSSSRRGEWRSRHAGYSRYS